MTYFIIGMSTLIVGAVAGGIFVWFDRATVQAALDAEEALLANLEGLVKSEVAGIIKAGTAKVDAAEAEATAAWARIKTILGKL